MTEKDREQTLMVTSDRGLQIRLIEGGLNNIMKSGAWLRLCKSILSEDIYNNVCCSNQNF